MEGLCFSGSQWGKWVVCMGIAKAEAGVCPSELDLRLLIQHVSLRLEGRWFVTGWGLE